MKGLRAGIAWLVIAGALPLTARAALRAMYGGDLVITSPSPPQTGTPAAAWSTVEVLLASAQSAPLTSVLDGPLEATGSAVRMRVRPDVVWPDGSPITADGVAAMLRQSLTDSSVALPPFAFSASGHEVVARLPWPLVGAADLLMLPWLRLAQGHRGGGFRFQDGVSQADSDGVAGRSYADHVWVEVREGRHIDPGPNAVVLRSGRPIFALVRPDSPMRESIAGALATLDRIALIQHFVRVPAHLPAHWPIPPAPQVAASGPDVSIAVDASEHDLRTVAERLQVVLRTHEITGAVAAEDRDKYRARLASRSYDVALVALPAAPDAVQAATLMRLVRGPAAAEELWSRVAKAGNPDAKLLREAADSVGAVLLYEEDSGLDAGSRVHGLGKGPLWSVDPSNVWLSPGGVAP